MSEKTKYYKLYCGNKPCGRFTGTKPKQAASKAFTSLMQKNKTDGPVEFSIRESSRGCDKKEYSYIGERKELDIPMTAMIGGKEITYKYVNNIHRQKKIDKKNSKKKQNLEDENDIEDKNDNKQNNKEESDSEQDIYSYIDTNGNIHISI